MTKNNETTIPNGNVNASRETVNNNVSRYRYLGRAMRHSLNAKRNYRTI